MIPSPQTVRISHEGALHDATVAWRYDAGAWVVRLESPELGTLEAQESDAFEALCTLRARVEPHGWRIGVAGARAGYWPSGMARDQGGGLTVYRVDAGAGDPIVDTFSPVDPGIVSTLDEQRAEADRAWGT